MLLARADTIEKGGAKLEQAWQLLRVLPRRLRDRFPKQSEVRRENALQALEGQAENTSAQSHAERTDVVDEFGEKDEGKDVGDTVLRRR